MPCRLAQLLISLGILGSRLMAVSSDQPQVVIKAASLPPSSPVCLKAGQLLQTSGEELACCAVCGTTMISLCARSFQYWQSLACRSSHIARSVNKKRRWMVELFDLWTVSFNIERSSIWFVRSRLTFPSYSATAMPKFSCMKARIRIEKISTVCLCRCKTSLWIWMGRSPASNKTSS